VTLLAAWPVTGFNGIGRIIESAKFSIARPLLTMQRHTSLPEGMGGIGGFGQVTTISAERSSRSARRAD
jgi:hypothetical protein